MLKFYSTVQVFKTVTEIKKKICKEKRKKILYLLKMGISFTRTLKMVRSKILVIIESLYCISPEVFQHVCNDTILFSPVHIELQKTSSSFTKKQWFLPFSLHSIWAVLLCAVRTWSTIW